MGWASGIYSRIFGSGGWQSDKAALIKILASRHDTHDQDIADGLNTLRTELRGEALLNTTKVLTSVAGTNTITASMTSATPAGTLTGYAAGLTVILIPANTNSGAITLNINSLGALDVFGPGGVACTGGELAAGVPATLLLDAGSDDWIIQNPANSINASSSPTWTGAHTFTRAFSTGNVGAISLSSSVPQLEFEETAAAVDNKKWWIDPAGEQFRFRIGNDARNSSGTWLTVDRTGTTVDTVAFPTDVSAAFVVGTVSGTTLNSSRMKVRTATAGAAAATFSSGTTATASTLFVQNEATTGDNVFIIFNTESAGGTARGSVDFNRAGTLTRYNTTSDARLKQNFSAAKSAVDLLMAIPVESYDWIESGAHVEFGYVAQHVHEHFPDAVSTGDTWGIDKSVLVPILHRALQEALVRISALEAKLP